MSESTYHLHPDAEAAIVDAKAMLTRSARAGLITAAQASAELQQTIARIMVQGRVESADDRMINVTCASCGRAHRMRADVIEYRCACAPFVVRFAMSEQSGVSIVAGAELPKP